VDVLTAQDDGTTELLDSELLDRASGLNRIVFTNDRDFPAEAARRQALGQPFSSVVFARPRHVSHGTCIDDLEIIAKHSSEDEAQNRVIYLPL
jgi:predicted nuclease of predicted toxin-antitoxin system